MAERETAKGEAMTLAEELAAKWCGQVTDSETDAPYVNNCAHAINEAIERCAQLIAATPVVHPADAALLAKQIRALKGQP